MKYKSHKQPLSGHDTRVYEVREEMGTDLHGPMRIQTPSHARYLAVLVDFCTDYNYLTLTVTKSQYTTELIKILKKINHKYGKHVIRLRIDGDGVFVNKKLKQFCDKNSIELICTAPYSSAQNGRSERKIRTITESSLSMLDFSGLPETFWGEAAKYSNRIINILPDARGKYKTSKLDRFDPSVAHKDYLRYIRIFGCAAWVFVEVRRKGRARSQSSHMLFVGTGRFQNGVPVVQFC